MQIKRNRREMNIFGHHSAISSDRRPLLQLLYDFAKLALFFVSCKLFAQYFCVSLDYFKKELRSKIGRSLTFQVGAREGLQVSLALC